MGFGYFQWPPYGELFNFRLFSAISYLVCVSRTTVSIPLETMQLIHISLTRSRKWAREHIYVSLVREEHINRLLNYLVQGSISSRFQSPLFFLP